MEDAQFAYSTLAGTDKHINVEIFREKTSLIQFSVPWKSRVQSSFLAHPHDTSISHSSSEIKVPLSSSKNPRASVFDPWMGFNKSTPGVWNREKLFMCVPGMDVPPSRRVIHFYLFFTWVFISTYDVILITTTLAINCSYKSFMTKVPPFPLSFHAI